MEKSDGKLVGYLTVCDSLEVRTVIGFLDSKVSSSSQELAKRCRWQVPAHGTNKRRKLAEEIVALLRWYGSDSLAYGLRRLVGKEGGVHYHEIVRGVAKEFNNHLKRKQRITMPRIATVEQWEAIITRLLLSASLQGKSVAEMTEMLTEAGLDQEAAKAAAKKYGPGLGGLALPVLAKILGKKTVTVILEQMLIAMSAKFMGKQAAKALAKRLLMKFAQRTWLKLLSWLGWILVVTDVGFFLTSAATRITIPSVAAMSLYRTRSRLRGTKE